MTNFNKFHRTGHFWAGIFLLTATFMMPCDEICAQARTQTRTQNRIPADMPDVVAGRYLNLQRLEIDPEVLQEHGLQLLSGKYVTIVTDIPLNDAIRALPEQADAAFPQICAYFGTTPTNWKLSVFLMRDKKVFAEAGFLPKILPPFENGFSFNYDCWVCDQPSDYYRLHLVIHEMVHSFSNTVLGHVGPGWYAESLAELLGMHELVDGLPVIHFMPTDKAQVPYCGRVREVKEALARKEARPFRELFRSLNSDYTSNEVYYWGWALAQFFEQHPDAQKDYRTLISWLKEDLSDDEFTKKFQTSLEPKIQTLERQWMMYVATLDYAYDLAPMLFDTTDGQPLSAGEKTIQNLRVDRSWQNTGISVKSGDVLRIRAKGEYELCQGGDLFYPCEPNGITIRYHRGQPLGVLQACILTDAPLVTAEILNDDKPGTFVNPLRIGLSRKFMVPSSGTLLLRINDSSTHLSQNRGKLAVEITKQ